ncbi:hypothetical protein GCM10007860_07250 [Chitiniphilus shinanonensis]|uniref:Uncharacterized protein n=1 Tax=Chitiniphilus shinanonensis TaxID=553088 RepID=A0ABQ6BNI9_9NEIS|nr:hypothetical protein [Chitiniphilus shinanonensis]GLS03580.1 hypothetical protein GCM10007860_07250 [Chitiniphilus shinanonensis]
MDWQSSLRASKGGGAFVTGKASAAGSADSVSHHRNSIAFRAQQTDTLAPMPSLKRNADTAFTLSPMGGVAGAGGDPPRRPNGFDKSNTGHYAPEGGPFIPLPASMAAQMQPNDEMRRVRPRLQPQQAPQQDGPPARLQRANSMPSVGDNAGFYHTFRSVATHGLLSQNEMRDRGISFNPSNDGRQRNAGTIDVTRLPGHLGNGQGEMSRQAVSNPHHGALSVVLERDQPLGFQPATIDDLDPQRREMLSQVPESMRASLTRSVVAALPQRLSDPDDASRRMHNSFMAIGSASTPSNVNGAHEMTRPGMPPAQIDRLVVPEQHRSTVGQVRRDLGARGGTAMPPVEFVHSTSTMVPQYQSPRGDINPVQGVRAPAYQHAVTSHAQQHGDTDIHIVKTGMQDQPRQPQTRPRSKSI